jgi:hypothetical protein
VGVVGGRVAWGGGGVGGSTCGICGEESRNATHYNSNNIPYLHLQSHSKEMDKRVESPFRKPEASQ